MKNKMAASFQFDVSLDTCPFGDGAPGDKVLGGQFCSTKVASGNGQCYYGTVARVCCRTCGKMATGIQGRSAIIRSKYK